MTHKFSRQEVAAQRLIKKNGTVCQIIRRNAPTGPAHNQTAGDDTPEDCQAFLGSYKRSEIDGTLVQMDDRKALVSTVAVTSDPTPQDRFRVGSQEYKIISVAPLSPADTPLLWTLQLRV